MLANLPVSARALNKRVSPAGGTSIFGRMNSDASGGLINNTAVGSSAFHHHRRHRLLRPTAATTTVAGGGGNVSGSLSHSSSFNHGRGSTHHLQVTSVGGGGGGGGGTRGSGVGSGTVRRERERELGGSGGVGSAAASASTCVVPVGDGTRKANYGNYYGQYGGAVGVGANMVSGPKARESLLVAEWVLEPESRAVGMRKPSFEGPLVRRRGNHWFYVIIIVSFKLGFVLSLLVLVTDHLRKWFDGRDKKGGKEYNKCTVLWIPCLSLMAGVGVMDNPSRYITLFNCTFSDSFLICFFRY